MTLQELCKKYNYAENTVIHGFPRIKESIFKNYGITIIRNGKGKKAEYIEVDRNKEKQIEELQQFLDKNPYAKEYLEKLNK